MSIEQDKCPTPRLSFRFRIVHLLYAAALVCSALSAFGIDGMVPAVMVCAAWGWVFASRSRPQALPAVLLFVLLSGCLYGLLSPALSAAREASRRMQCANNLKQIALALHDYHDVYNSFPPAYIADKNGRPIHSWRVLILPFIEEQVRYDAYRFDEPWDGPNNRKLLSPMPSPYYCSSHGEQRPIVATHTNYVAIAGENTIWPGSQATDIGDILDGTSQTLLVCEIADRDISWMEPIDLDYADAIELLTSRDLQSHWGHTSRSYFYERSAGRNIALADGSIHYLNRGIEMDEARRMLMRNDNERFDINETYGASIVVQRLRIGNCIRLGLFVLLALWPLPWVWINPQGTRSSHEGARA